MPKKAKSVKDFVKKKRKVGKRKPDASNVTKTNVKARKVYLPTQVVDATEASNLSIPSLIRGGRALTLTDILARCGHPNGNVRADAVQTLLQIEAQERESEHGRVSAWIGLAIEKTLTMLEDKEKPVRTSVRTFLKTAEMFLESYRDVLAARLAAAACSLHTPVRLDAVETIDKLSSLLVRTHQSSKTITSALQDVLMASLGLDYHARKTTAATISSLISAFEMKEETSEGKKSDRKVWFYGPTLTEEGSENLDIRGEITQLLMSAVPKLIAWFKEVAPADKIVSDSGAAEKMLPVVQTLVRISEFSKKHMLHELQQLTSERAFDLNAYFPLQKLSAESSFPPTIHQLEGLLACLFSTSNHPVLFECLSEYVVSSSGGSIVAISKAYLRVGSSLAPDARVENCRKWIETWKQSDVMDRANVVCLEFFEEAFKTLIHEQKVHDQRRKAALKTYLSIASALPRLMWDLVKAEAAPQLLDRVSRTLFQLVHWNRDFAAGLKTLGSGLIRLISSKRGSENLPGPVRFLEQECRRRVIGALEAVWSSRNKPDLDSELLQAIAVCVENEDCARSGLTDDLLAFLAEISISARLLSDFLRVLIIAIEVQTQLHTRDSGYGTFLGGRTYADLLSAVGQTRANGLMLAVVAIQRTSFSSTTIVEILRKAAERSNGSQKAAITTLEVLVDSHGLG